MVMQIKLSVDVVVVTLLIFSRYHCAKQKREDVQ